MMEDIPLGRSILGDIRFVVVAGATERTIKIRYLGNLWENAFPPGVEGSDEEFVEKLVEGCKADGLVEQGRVRLYQASYAKVWDSEEEAST